MQLSIVINFISIANNMSIYHFLPKPWISRRNLSRNLETDWAVLQVFIDNQVLGQINNSKVDENVSIEYLVSGRKLEINRYFHSGFSLEKLLEGGDGKE